MYVCMVKIYAHTQPSLMIDKTYGDKLKVEDFKNSLENKGPLRYAM
jgi:hypothetical protein